MKAITKLDDFWLILKMLMTAFRSFNLWESFKESPLLYVSLACVVLILIFIVRDLKETHKE